MQGQITINEWLGYPEYYDECGQKQKSWMREGFKNAYREMPNHDILAEVIDHAENRFKTRIYRNKFGNMVFDATKSKGYDIAWWKEIGIIYSVNIKGICDDAYCPNCNYEFDDKEVDCARCPECKTWISWSSWHRINDQEAE